MIGNDIVGSRVEFCFRTATDDNYTGKGILVALELSGNGHWVFLVWDDNGRMAECCAHDITRLT